VGILKLKTKQAERLGLKPRSQLSPLLEKCCLRLSANESYQNASAEIEALTGMVVGHSTQQRLVLRQELPLPSALQGAQKLVWMAQKCVYGESRKPGVTGEITRL
jgi:hypothetical protein